MMKIYDEFGNRIGGVSRDEMDEFLDAMPDQEWADNIARNLDFTRHERDNNEELDV